MSMRIRLIASALLLVAATAHHSARADDTAKTDCIKVEVTGLRNDKGRLGCALWPGPEGFPRDDSHVLRNVWAKIENCRGECIFARVPAGDYAVTLFHDEDSDGKFKSNFFGYPLEGYGFSNNVAPTFRAPSFDEAKFHYDGTGTKQMSVRMIYR